MIDSLQISGVHSVLTEEVRSYAQKKIGGLDRFIPKKARPSVKTEIKIKQAKTSDNKKYECEIVMSLPQAKLTVHEKATTILAAIDTAEDNLKNQLKKYKDTHDGPRVHRRLMSRLKRRLPNAQDR
jgi:putative sigma-54 modulation protein